MDQPNYLREAVQETQKYKSVTFAQWLNAKHHGNIYNVDFDKEYDEFNIWYEKQQEEMRKTNPLHPEF